MTGVLAAFRANVTVTPAGIVTVVKLKTPLGGSGTVVLAVGANTPSAPVLPLLNVCADTGHAHRIARRTLAIVIRSSLRFLFMANSFLLPFKR